MAVVNIGGVEYGIADPLKKRWDKIKDGQLFKTDQDRVYVVDGRERSGKSVFTFQQACYIDPSLVGDLSRVCFSAEEFLSAVKKTNSSATETKCIIFDEAFRGLSSRTALSKINKKIIQALMEVGQKNLVLWIVLPSIFMLDLYPAMLRSNALFHIKKEQASSQRAFYVYSYKKKGQLYQAGVRKGWTYAIKTRNKGRFSKKMPGGDDFDRKYRAKKLKAINESENVIDKAEESSKFMKQRDLMVYDLVENRGLSQQKASDHLNKLGITLSQRMISEILAKTKVPAPEMAQYA